MHLFHNDQHPKEVAEIADITPIVIDTVKTDNGKGVLAATAERFGLGYFLLNENVYSELAAVDNDLLEALNKRLMPIIVADTPNVLLYAKNVIIGTYQGCVYWIGGPSMRETPKNSADAATRETILGKNPTVQMIPEDCLKEDQIVYFGTEVGGNAQAEKQNTYYDIAELRSFGIYETIDKLLTQTTKQYPSGIIVHINCDKIAIDDKVTSSSNFIALQEITLMLEKLFDTEAILAITMSSGDLKSSQIAIGVLAQSLNTLFGDKKLRRRVMTTQEYADRQTHLHKQQKFLRVFDLS